MDTLAVYDISAERKSLYNDIENLRVYGLDVIGTKEDRTYACYIRHKNVDSIYEVRLWDTSIPIIRIR